VDGLTLLERRRLKAAEACFEQAVESEPDSVDGWFWLAVTRDNRGQEAEAIPAYRKALDLGLDDPNRRAQAWTWLASSLSKTADHPGAVEALVEAERLNGYQPEDEYQRVHAAIEGRSGRASS